LTERLNARHLVIQNVEHGIQLCNFQHETHNEQDWFMSGLSEREQDKEGSNFLAGRSL
jgi:hypothetical protein